jgi:hypothetical protein
MVVVCPNCKLCFIRLESHLRHNPSCRIVKAPLAKLQSQSAILEEEQQDGVSPPDGWSDNDGSLPDDESLVQETLLNDGPERLSCPPSHHFTNTDDLLEEFISDCIIPRL